MSDAERILFDKVGKLNDKVDDIKDSLSTTCQNITEIKTLLNSHLETFDKEHQESLDKVRRKTDVKLVILGVLFAAVESITLAYDAIKGH